ncbi:MAG: SCP2 sterol-binding domain-containing protein [Clostridiales bacterium]|nr:SCP2 sterol-binding domain-containing protein [Clostridiales bacterium]
MVTADSRAWNDVLSKKVTAQKAFMMGQLKVRGNFVLLTKFDQMFNTIS